MTTSEGDTNPRAEPAPAELESVRLLVNRALDEDLDKAGDLTSTLLIPAEWRGSVHVVARQRGVVSGLAFLPIVIEQLRAELNCQPFQNDGDSVAAGTLLAEIFGPVRALLTAERTMLNLLTHLSGIASLTRQFVDLVTGTRAVILDTRKTVPGLRLAQKYAVRCGGGINHRLGLYDGILIKDNHLAAWRQRGGESLANLLKLLRDQAPSGIPIEIEVDSLDQLEEALPGAPDIVLCDNMTPDLLRQAVALRDHLAPKVLLEASGGISLATVRSIAATGVDRISCGALTHSAPALDIGFDWPL